MILLKLSDELLAGLGATTALQAVVAIDKLIKSMADVKTEQAEHNAFRELVLAELTKISASQGDLLAKIKTLEARPAGMDAEAVETIARSKAEAVASRLTAKALGAVGSPPIPSSQAVSNPAEAQTIPASDYEGRWKADPQLHDEFPNFKAFAAYEAAMAGGKVRILSKPGRN